MMQWLVVPFQGVQSPWVWIFDGVLTIQVPERPNLLWRSRFYQGVLIQCQSYHGDYVCTLGRAAMSDGDGIDLNTRVPATRGVWVPMVLSYHGRHLMMLPLIGPVLSISPGAEYPQVRLLGARARPQSFYEEGSFWADRW
jgi:hypothetical protein